MWANILSGQWLQSLEKEDIQHGAPLYATAPTTRGSDIAFAKQHRQGAIISDGFDAQSCADFAAEIKHRVTDPDVAQELRRMQATPSMAVIRCMGWLLGKAWRRLFEAVLIDEASVEVMKQKMALWRSQHDDLGVVMLATHKSHVDYLLMSYVCFAYGLPLPHIAAGDNLDIPLVGSIFRRSGSFFIKRQLTGDVSFKRALRWYVQAMLGRGFCLEFFPEGGRSRHGCILPAKLGLLRMVIDTLTTNSADSGPQGGIRPGRVPQDIMLVPVCIDYEHVAEAEGYVEQLLGKPKRKESLWGALASIVHLMLRPRQACVAVRFGKPLLVKEWLRNPSVHINMPTAAPGTSSITTDAPDDHSAVLSSTVSHGLRAIIPLPRSPDVVCGWFMLRWTASDSPFDRNSDQSPAPSSSDEPAPPLDRALDPRHPMMACIPPHLQEEYDADQRVQAETAAAGQAGLRRSYLSHASLSSVALASTGTASSTTPALTLSRQAGRSALGRQFSPVSGFATATTSPSVPRRPMRYRSDSFGSRAVVNLGNHVTSALIRSGALTATSVLAAAVLALRPQPHQARHDTQSLSIRLADVHDAYVQIARACVVGGDAMPLVSVPAATPARLAAARPFGRTATGAEGRESLLAAFCARPVVIHACAMAGISVASMRGKAPATVECLATPETMLRLRFYAAQTTAYLARAVEGALQLGADVEAGWRDGPLTTLRLIRELWHVEVADVDSHLRAQAADPYRSVLPHSLAQAVARPFVLSVWLLGQGCVVLAQQFEERAAGMMDHGAVLLSRGVLVGCIYDVCRDRAMPCARRSQRASAATPSDSDAGVAEFKNRFIQTLATTSVGVVSTPPTEPSSRSPSPASLAGSAAHNAAVLRLYPEAWTIRWLDAAMTLWLQSGLLYELDSPGAPTWPPPGEASAVYGTPSPVAASVESHTIAQSISERQIGTLTSSRSGGERAAAAVNKSSATPDVPVIAITLPRGLNSADVVRNVNALSL